MDSITLVLLLVQLQCAEDSNSIKAMVPMATFMPKESRSSVVASQ